MAPSGIYVASGTCRGGAGSGVVAEGWSPLGSSLSAGATLLGNRIHTSCRRKPSLNVGYARLVRVSVRDPCPQASADQTIEMLHTLKQGMRFEHSAAYATGQARYGVGLRAGSRAGLISASQRDAGYGYRRWPSSAALILFYW